MVVPTLSADDAANGAAGVVTPVTVAGAVPELVMLKLRDTGVPVGVEPNDSDVGVTVIRGAGGEAPAVMTTLLMACRSTNDPVPPLKPTRTLAGTVTTRS